MHPQTLSPKPCTKQEGKETAGKEREKKKRERGRGRGKEKKKRGKRKKEEERKKEGKERKKEERKEKKKRGKRKKKRKEKEEENKAPAAKRPCEAVPAAARPSFFAQGRKSDRVRPRGAPKKTGFSFSQFHFFLYGQVVARAHNEKKNLKNIFWIFFGIFFSLFFLILGLHFVLFCVGS